MKTLKFLFTFLLITSIFACKKEQTGALSVADSTKTGNLITSSKNNAVTAVTTLTVAQDGTGNYSTVQAAINAVVANNGSRTVISVKNGTYSEVVTVPSNK